MFITFYSYKGGVGRSLALMNVAYALAKMGRRIFIMDFDLEAPGLDAIAGLDPSLGHKGIVEYIAQYKSESRPPKLSEFVVGLHFPECDGKIHLMPAGRKDPNYQVELNKIDWKDFYRRDNGFYLIENLKGQISEEYKPDYVLIDSRTGLTDIGGICTLQLPEAVVMVFNLNDQNLHGIRQVMRSIQYNAIGKDIRTLLLASPIPDMSHADSLLSQRLKHAAQILGRPITSHITYSPSLALKEEIVLASHIETPIAAQYAQLANEVVGLNETDFEHKLSLSTKLLSAGKPEAANGELVAVTQAYPENYHVQLRAAALFRQTGHLKQAFSAARRAQLLKPGEVRPKIEIALLSIGLNQRKKARLALDSVKHAELPHLSDQFLRVPEIYLDLGEKRKAKNWLMYGVEVCKRTRIGPHNDDTIFSLAESLCQVRAYREAAVVYKKYLDYIPTSLPACYNYAHCLFLTGEVEGLVYYQKSITFFENRRETVDKVLEANQLQAIHFAYLNTGQPVKALECLTRARHLLGTFAEGGAGIQIFSPVLYKLISLAEFLKENTRLIGDVRRRLKKQAAFRKTA